MADNYDIKPVEHLQNVGRLSSPGQRKKRKRKQNQREQAQQRQLEQQQEQIESTEQDINSTTCEDPDDKHSIDYRA